MHSDLFDEGDLAKLPGDDPRTTHNAVHQIDSNALRLFIYPTNVPVRDYQFNIVRSALFHNVLVTLPTGLGKTFIASAVMLNYMRWFPKSKLIFMAPTRPLVAQQIKACCGTAGIPTSSVAILLEKTKKNREAIWAEKLVFFTTPQVVENDLCLGIVNPKLISLLVIDEAHRAKGNYAYNNVVKFVSRFSSSFRVLALTATPASDVDGVQEIVLNLGISKIEVRTEHSIDTFKYLKKKDVERFTVGQSADIQHAVKLLCEAAQPILTVANQRKIYEVQDPARINAFTAMDAQRKVRMNPAMPEGLKWSNFFILLLLMTVGQCLRRLNVYGLRSFYSYFNEKHLEFTTKHAKKKSKNQMAINFYHNEKILELMSFCNKLLGDPTYLGHPKLDLVISKVTRFFETTENANSRVIIFTEYRESALDIVRCIEQTGSGLRPHIFIGQAKEKDRFDESQLTKTKTKGRKKSTPNDAEGTSSEKAQAKGMSQKMQKEIIEKFKDGEFNILVATSIGEEGLDIGEVDLIVCYDSTSSPIKNVQRMGRTGRSRDGRVVMLFSGNEERKFDHAMMGYEHIQQQIMKGDNLELSAQNRIIPRGVEPEAKLTQVPIPESNLPILKEENDDEIIKVATKCMKVKSTTSRTRREPATKKKFFMPDNVKTGFTTASTLMQHSPEQSLTPEDVILPGSLTSVSEKSGPKIGPATNVTEPKNSFGNHMSVTQLLKLLSMRSDELFDWSDSQEQDEAEPYNKEKTKSEKSIGEAPRETTERIQATSNDNGADDFDDSLDDEFDDEDLAGLLTHSNQLKQIVTLPKKDVMTLEAEPQLSKKELTLEPKVKIEVESTKILPENVCGTQQKIKSGGKAVTKRQSPITGTDEPPPKRGAVDKKASVVPRPPDGEAFLDDKQKEELYMSYFVPPELDKLGNCFDPHYQSQDQKLTIKHSEYAKNVFKYREIASQTNKPRDKTEVSNGNWGSGVNRFKFR